MKYILLIILFIAFSCKKEMSIGNKPPTNEYFDRAVLFKNNNSSDSAFYYFNLSKNDFLGKNDSLGTARALVNMAIIQNDKGDFYGSIETSLETNKFLENEQGIIAKKILTSNYNNIATASNSLRNYDSAIIYYKKAIQIADNNEAKYICYNNIGDALINQGKISLAKKYLSKAILADSVNNYSRALNNYAKVKYLDDKNYNPLSEFNKALAIRKKINDGAGLNSSYETLSSYYLDKDKKMSLEYAKKMLKEATQNKSSDDQITALKRIILLEPENYLQNFEKLDSINENVQTSRNQHKSQFAVIRYDVEQKDAENKNLKLEDAENKINIIYLSFGLGILTFTLFLGYFWNEKRKENIRQEKEKEKELEVKSTELKYSKKVHDVVANGLYHMMIDVQNNPDINKVRILNDIEKMYEESRDIANENSVEKDFSSRFSNMISSYSSPEQKVLTVGYTDAMWENISHNIQLELYYILRELLVNMKKHSRAKLIVLKFEKNKNSLSIKYTDNGVGINDLKNRKGTGIFNTENRMEMIGGDINFEKNPKGGLIIQLVIPTN